MLQDADGHVLTSITSTRPGARLSVRVADGRVHAEVTELDPITPPVDQEAPDG